MIYIACGSNLRGDYTSSDDVLYAAYEAIEAQGIKIIEKSSIWFTRPVPDSNQPWFRNSVIAVQTDLSPHNLLKTLKAIECDFGRDQKAARNAARVLDLDILKYHDLKLSEEGLTIPHPRMHDRPFVMLPFKEVA